MVPDLAARKIIVAAYIYYCLDHNIMSDAEYDKLSQYVADNWDKLAPARQWCLGSADQTRASGFHIRFTRYAVSAARQAYAKDRGRNPTHPYPEEEDWLTGPHGSYVTTAPH